MIPVLDIARRRAASYRAIVGEQVVDEIEQLAADLEGARVLHINATAFGGGVSELLSTVVPLMNDIGLACEWHVMEGDPAFFRATKAMHNGLQGMPVEWSAEMAETWRATNRNNARMLEDSWDFVVVHDAQPAAVLAALEMESGRRPSGRWIWRCHVDLTDARDDVWAFLNPYVGLHDAAVFTLGSYVRHDLRPQVMIIPPAIDPLSPKNMPIEKVAIRSCLDRYKVDPNRPIVVQVSRFDPWKDPIGVIDAFRLAKTEVRGLQLVLVGSMADDDPEGWEWYERTVAHAATDSDIHVLTNLDGANSFEVNCFQRAADVVVQKSLREGFGLVVSEALWKERALVSTSVGGLPLQVVDGSTGRFATDSDDFSDQIVDYLRHPEERRRSGLAGREHVRQNFLITRYLRDYLLLFRHLGAPRLAEARQPVELTA
ncbi:MAG: glycosyltransferase [Dehalococcoidia bacterium]|nr:glycosyltransferase [Dehalococcoidia bacterium]